jgi:hypothetical protein
MNDFFADRRRSSSFEYKFRSSGGGSATSQHCTYCPKQMGEGCAISCANVYEKIKAERAADGVIINDEPSS